MSNQTKPAPPKIVVAPDGCKSWLTAGKEYSVIGLREANGKTLFVITDDEGDPAYCLEDNCAQLNGGNWIIKEREVSHD